MQISACRSDLAHRAHFGYLSNCRAVGIGPWHNQQVTCENTVRMHFKGRDCPVPYWHVQPALRSRKLGEAREFTAVLAAGTPQRRELCTQGGGVQEVQCGDNPRPLPIAGRRQG